MIIKIYQICKFLWGWIGLHYSRDKLLWIYFENCFYLSNKPSMLNLMKHFIIRPYIGRKEIPCNMTMAFIINHEFRVSIINFLQVLQIILVRYVYNCNKTSSGLPPKATFLFGPPIIQDSLSNFFMARML